MKKSLLPICMSCIIFVANAQEWMPYNNSTFGFKASLPATFEETSSVTDETTVNKVSCNVADHSFYVTLTRYHQPINATDPVTLAAEIIASSLREDDQLISVASFEVNGHKGKQAVIYSRANAFYVDRRVIVKGDDIYSFITILGDNNVTTYTQPFFETVSIMN